MKQSLKIIKHTIYLFFYTLPLFFLLNTNINSNEYSDREKIFELKWEKNIKDKLTSITSSTDKNNYFIYSISENGKISALNKETGKEEWSATSQGKIKSPPIIADEKIFYGTTDGTLYALLASYRTEKWKLKVKNAIYSSPFFSRGVLYFGSWDKHLYATRADNGKLLWNFKAEQEISISPVIYDNIVFACSLDGYIYALDSRDGSKLWSLKTDWPGVNFQPVVDKRNGLIITASSDKNIYAIDPIEGKIKWKFTTDSPGIHTGIIIVENKIFISSFDGNLYCLNSKNGDLLWNIKLGKIYFTTPAYSEDTLYIASEFGELFALEISNGNIKWRYKINEHIQKSPQLFEGMIFLAVEDGYLYGVDTLFGDIKFQYVVDYSSEHLIYYDYNTEMFYFFDGKNKLIAFNKTKEKNELLEEIENLSSDNNNETIIDNNSQETEKVISPIFSPDGKFYLYSDKKPFDYNLYRVEILNDTKKIVKITQSTFNDLDPQWAPDSTTVIFSSNKKGDYDIYKINMTKLDIFYYDEAQNNCVRTDSSTVEELVSLTPEKMDEKHQKQLTKDTCDERFPISSVDGSKILYSSNQNGNWDLWIMDKNGENKTKLTYEPSDDENARFSPNGTKIAYVSARMKDKDVYVINSDGTGLYQLTHSEQDEINPEWVNDSTIVYEKISQNKKYSNIWCVHLQSQIEFPITQDVTAKNYYPKPSPDGKKIAFLSNRDFAGTNIWLTNSTGKNLIKISNVKEEINPFTWYPDSKKILILVNNENSDEKKEYVYNIESISLFELFSQAEEAIINKDYNKANEIYYDIIYNYPNQKIMALIEPNHFSISSYAAAYYKMSIIEERQNNQKQKISLWENILNDYNNDIDEQKMFSLKAFLRLKIVEELFANGEYQKAIDIYKYFLIDFPTTKNEWGYENEPYVMLRIAECYEKLEKYQLAIKAYTEVQEKFPNSKIMLSEDYIGSVALAFANIANIYKIQYKDYDNALQYYLKIVEKYPVENYTTAKGNIRGSYSQNAFTNISKIYKKEKINFDVWIKMITEFNEKMPKGVIKSNLETIVKNLEKLKSGESLVDNKSINSRMIFCSRQNIGDISSNNYEIFSINENGTDIKRLTYNDANDYRPGWSPDGGKIAYYTLNLGNYEIFTMDFDGTNNKNISRSPNSYDLEPAWDRDGGRLSFTSDRDGNMEIYTMTEDGSEQINITNHPAKDYESNWYPNGDKIIFTSERDKNMEIYQLDLDTNVFINLTQNKADDHEGVFSPDGTKIIFTSNRDKNEEIYIMNIDGTEQTNLTNHDSYDYNPTWSSDGKSIFFVSSRKGNPKIFKMNIDGSDQIQITFDSESYDILPNILKSNKY